MRIGQGQLAYFSLQFQQFATPVRLDARSLIAFGKSALSYDWWGWGRDGLHDALIWNWINGNFLLE